MVLFRVQTLDWFCVERMKVESEEVCVSFIKIKIKLKRKFVGVWNVSFRMKKEFWSLAALTGCACARDYHYFNH